MIEIGKEKLLSYDEAAEMTRKSRRTIEKWVDRGLEMIRIGGSVFTSCEALNRFARHDSVQGVPDEEADAAQRELKARFGV